MQNKTYIGDIHWFMDHNLTGWLVVEYQESNTISSYIEILSSLQQYISNHFDTEDYHIMWLWGRIIIKRFLRDKKLSDEA